MHRLVLAAAVAAAFLLTAVLLGMPATVSAAPVCFGQPATHVMKPGEGTYHGTVGNDVVVGSSGTDFIHLDPSGVDLVCGGGGIDNITMTGTGVKADGGPGDDHLNANQGAQVFGGAGNDNISVNPDSFGADESGDDVFIVVQAAADGGSGDDRLLGYDHAVLSGGSGNHVLYDSVGTLDRADCGSGTDTIRTDNPSLVTRRCERIAPL